METDVETKVIWRSPYGVRDLVITGGIPEDLPERCFAFGNDHPMAEGPQVFEVIGEHRLGAHTGPSMSVGDTLELFTVSGMSLGQIECAPVGWKLLA